MIVLIRPTPSLKIRKLYQVTDDRVKKRNLFSLKPDNDGRCIVFIRLLEAHSTRKKGVGWQNVLCVRRAQQAFMDEFRTSVLIRENFGLGGPSKAIQIKSIFHYDK